MSVEKIQVCSLKLVYPPISNQEAEWITDDPGVEKALRKSNVYMIVSRAEAKFLDLKGNQKDTSLSFRFVIGDRTDDVQIAVAKLPAIASGPDKRLELEAGEKIIRIWEVDSAGKQIDLLDWFTTESLLYDRWHNKSGISGLNKFKDLATYELLYAGISKKEDSFQRLLVRPHDKRLRILSNEPQRSPGARVTDEIYLLFFRVETLRVHTFLPGHEFTEEDFVHDLDEIAVVADAEKAFVRFLDTRYNTIKFQDYPRGVDGLHQGGLKAYAYAICEDVTLYTSTSVFHGGFHPDLPCSDEADGIIVRGDDAVLLTADAMKEINASQNRR